MSILRLELVVLIVLVFLYKLLKNELEIKIIFWIDYMIVLYYIANEFKCFYIYIVNRVVIIREDLSFL